jgi:hypothetical protein
VPVPNQTALLEQIKADLLARGIIPQNPTDNRTPFEIISRLASALRGHGARLIRKGPGQNGDTVERGPRAAQRILEKLEARRRDVNDAGKTLVALAGGGGLGNIAQSFKR